MSRSSNPSDATRLPRCRFDSVFWRCRGSVKDQKAMIADLRELVKALDRRVPRLERAGEDKIACEAAALRVKAMKRLAQLQSPV